MQKNKALNLLNTIFLLIGIAVMAVGIFILIHMIKFAGNADEVEAIITDIQTYRGYDDETEHDVFVKYVYEGFEHEVELDSYSSSMYVGKTITILVNREEPREVMVKGLDYLFTLIPIGIGLVFALVGGVPMIVGRRKGRKQQLLKENGRRIQATIDDITVNYHFSVNGRHPYQILCSYKDEYTAQVYCFKSGNIWKDPYLVCDVGSLIDVWIKQDNYDKYFVDVDALAEKRIMDYT